MNGIPIYGDAIHRAIIEHCNAELEQQRVAEPPARKVAAAICEIHPFGLRQWRCSCGTANLEIRITCRACGDSDVRIEE